MPDPVTPPAGPYDDLLSAWLETIRQAGEQPSKIAMIKRLREATRLGLKDAKDAVESFGHRHGILELEPRRVGCVPMVVVLVAITARLFV